MTDSTAGEASLPHAVDTIEYQESFLRSMLEQSQNPDNLLFKAKMMFFELQDEPACQARWGLYEADSDICTGL